ncbi:hypothetical protein CHL9426_05205 [Campylobacter hyointestinalis subsp. lawsonii]|nr:hypothetical protein CHL9752_08230 [Campylobacter hyointestinalis subsp. lawsonii]RAZ38611.1 hypothetical protein CHL9426_05205 [Campylobacter hyointestinalis subsp. lawsonii]
MASKNSDITATKSKKTSCLPLKFSLIFINLLALKIYFRLLFLSSIHKRIKFKKPEEKFLSSTFIYSSLCKFKSTNLLFFWKNHQTLNCVAKAYIISKTIKMAVFHHNFI